MMKNGRSIDRSGDHGFTLVEILIVIVVLGIVATVAVFSVRGISARGQTASCGEDRRIMLSATEAHFAQSGSSTILTSNPAVGGVSGLTAEATLVEVGLLATESALHDVAADGTVSVAAGASC